MYICDVISRFVGCTIVAGYASKVERNYKIQPKTVYRKYFNQLKL